jgi:hypothetical protein
VQLGEQASLRGLVLDANGGGVGGLQVRLYAPQAFPGAPAAALTVTTTAADGTFSFTGLAAPSDFVVAVYSSPTSLDALDSELVASVPGTAVDVPTFRAVTPS